MKYRLAHLSDAEWLAEWNHQLIRDERHRNPMTVPELEMRMRRWLSGEYQAMIFEKDNRVVAYALYRESAGHIHLRHFFVHPRQRGKGVGSEAVQILLTSVWPAGKRVVVEVLLQNQAARTFWTSLGFQEYSITMEMLPRAPR